MILDNENEGLNIILSYTCVTQESFRENYFATFSPSKFIH